MVTVNYTGAVSSGLAVAAQFRRQGHGRLVVLSSVAGERVRKANFVYGSSKAGLDGFAQGLGDALGGSGASVLVVRPGFVHSRMTEGLKAAPFATTPGAVADATVKALHRGPPHGVGAGHACAPCSACSATCPAPSGAASRSAEEPSRSAQAGVRARWFSRSSISAPENAVRDAPRQIGRPVDLAAH